MGSKRKTDPSSAKDDCSKRAKHHRPSGTTEEEAVGGRLGVLETTIRDIMHTPESMQLYAAEAGPDVMRAAAELDKAFRARNLPSFPSRAVAETPKPDCTPKAHQGLNTAEFREEGHLPALPPISDPLLEKAAFTHPGVGSNNEATYDRLEILGDAYLELMATKLVLNKFHELPSGRISQIRESLVKNEALSELTTRYGLDSRASVPRDYLSQPKRWVKTKGDIFEAYVAAVILSDPSNGYQVVEDWVSALWMPQLATMEDQATWMHAKETLAKKIMGKGIKLKYVEERPHVTLEGGKETFFIGVYLTGWGWNSQHLGSGQGLSKAIAGNQAATHALLNEQLINEIAAVKYASEAEKRSNNPPT
ncbi:ribonuclease [Aspergillus sp. HF37]|nr:ribonuclease [Aspergillus sp. HF37]